MRAHPHDSLLRETIRRSGKITDKILEHVAGCAKCRERLALLTERKGIIRIPPKQEDYGPAFDRSVAAFELRQAVLERERGQAPALLGRLLGLTSERQQLLLNNSRRFQTWGVLELLIARGREETFTDPEHAEELLQLACDISGRLSSSFLYGRELVQDMQARTWGYIANARRVRMDLPASEEAFGEAFLHLRRGSEDPLERAVLFDLYASLQRLQKRVEESLQLSRRAISIFRRMGESHLLGRAMINSAISYRFIGNSTRAVSILYQALDLIDPTREPRLVLCALNNLTDTLTAAGRFMESQRMLIPTRKIFRQFPDPRLQSRRLWTEAKIAWGLNRFYHAETLLQKARDGFISAGAFHEIELVSRDWAEFRAGHDSTS